MTATKTLAHPSNLSKKEFGKKLLDLTGVRFGKLIAIRKGLGKKWLCACDCGKEKEIDQGNLRSGASKTCGCGQVNNKPQMNLNGQRFGKLKITGFHKISNGQKFWKALCDCGRESSCYQSDLINNRKACCGCTIPIKEAYRDLTGMKFGRLLVLNKAVRKARRNSVYWSCLCSCGNITEVQGHKIRTGRTKSCGCYKRETKGAMTHGMSKTRQYQTWSSMKARCYNPNQQNYPYYGGRGIIVHESWINNFAKFWEDTKEGYSDDLSIDRINYDGNYEPGNTRWVTHDVQMNNMRRNLVFEWKGERMTFSEICRHEGVDYNRTTMRMNLGWSLYDAVMQPIFTKIRFL